MDNSTLISDRDRFNFFYPKQLQVLVSPRTLVRVPFHSSQVRGFMAKARHMHGRRQENLSCRPVPAAQTPPPFAPKYAYANSADAYLEGSKNTMEMTDVNLNEDGGKRPAETGPAFKRFDRDWWRRVLQTSYIFCLFMSNVRDII